MKNLKKVLALVLAVVMIMSVVTVASAKTYTDVKATDNYADAIDILSNLKILDGFKDGDNYSFKAEDPFTRAQAAKIVAIIHNAATNGKIQDQDAISALYTNAQNNKFVDCNNSWALPFINYCRITGLADGMTATTYEPNRYVTGVQFLKLMLTTLNFDTNKEGYTGNGWDINVLNRANEVGLTAGLKDGWKAIAPITRGEAAQVLYNALQAYLVEYGQLIKNNYVGGYYKTSFISNEQVAKSGFTLAAKMGISIVRATDSFRRPGYTWTDATTGWTKFYMDTPKAEFKTAVTECEILKAMGIAENKTTEVKLNGWYKGDATGTDATSKASKLLVDGKSVPYTALNYYAVDGRKFGRSTNNPNDTGADGIVLQHKTNKDCQKLHGTWTKPVFGGQGDLTQVFQTEDGWVVTTIHTFLAEVTQVNKNNKYSHATPESAEIMLWLQNKNESDGSTVPPYSEDPVAVAIRTKAVTTVDYAKGTKVLVNLSLKKDETTNYASHYTWNAKDSAVATIVGAADSKTGKLTGASGLNQAETVSIDGTKYPAACRFVLGKDDAMNQQNNKEAYTFYFDSYGNVIGREAVSATSNYVVMDKIWAHADDGDFTVYANLYDLTGTAIEKVKVSLKAGSFKDFAPMAGEYAAAQAGKIVTLAVNNDEQLTNALYTYTVDDKGVYTLNYAGAFTIDGLNDDFGGETRSNAGYGRLAGTISHKEKTAYLKIGAFADPAAANTYINVSESTKFVVKGADKTWKVYNGYSELPTLTAVYCDYTVEAGGSGYASLVYLGDATYESASITGYVPTWKTFRWAGSYALVDVYVDGELTTVNVKPEFTLNGHNYRLGATAAQYPKPGMYKFNSKTDADGVVYCDVVSAEETLLAVGTASLVSGTSNDVTAFTVEGTAGAFNVSDTTIYFVKADGTIEKVDSSYIPGAYVAVYGTTDGGYHFAKTIYVFDRNTTELPAQH